MKYAFRRTTDDYGTAGRLLNITDEPGATYSQDGTRKSSTFNTINDALEALALHVKQGGYTCERGVELVRLVESDTPRIVALDDTERLPAGARPGYAVALEYSDSTHYVRLPGPGESFAYDYTDDIQKAAVQSCPLSVINAYFAAVKRPDTLVYVMAARKPRIVRVALMPDTKIEPVA